MGNVEIPKWLKNMPLAPEFHPTDTEFADPIAYISKIEKKASAFGICKIIPPLPKPSKKYVFHNLNKSLSKSPELVGGVDLPSSSSATDREARAVFTTRHQELGQGTRKTKGMAKENPQHGAPKQVWQSGEIYTLEQFESKSKAFAKSLLGSIKEINPLVIEALFWRAASDKPIHVEYANDVPGSGFGEPQGHVRYFHKRRRKRVSYKSFRLSKENTDTDCKSVELDNVIKKNEATLFMEMIPSSSSSSNSYTDEVMRCSSNDMEGSAGWKLSNSPWNLQIIARSPGSLTRFMPDDIPGVTSPMVYIGMLFSWFAWHVEDHELHSMNFLHTGSPKTWYSVPGDYAFTFEDIIRTEAYGGSIDRLAALSILGEKTTLLSPEVVVSSGVPCCRLVQNPGEFVVTFPRAYHVGFSHGFNCGEAANFGTPEWLRVAKEAAVRRAAMNYLPMLSHQQLLYLLTMSFVSRVPRSFLPGARSSRLRDRLKEERELSVKKAFIEDILKENSILTAILSKESNCGVVIWNPDWLPCASKESSANSSTTEENSHHTHSEDNSNNATGNNDVYKVMNLYLETLNDLYMENDDLSSDFQVDSGTLVCAACGILGFPFMSVVQPSSTECFSMVVAANSSAIPDGSIRCSFPDVAVPSGWNKSNKFLRPRIFCLEHGLQIEELLRSKGGANRRIICHSDYQKMKAHAVSIAEEIDTPFQYKEVSLESASPEDLNLIYLALDRGELKEDWTSKMGINLYYCVKSSSSKALALGGLFSNGTPSDLLNIKWQSRKSRSRMKPREKPRIEEERLIQYTRRKYKVPIDASSKKTTEQEISVIENHTLAESNSNLTSPGFSNIQHEQCSESCVSEAKGMSAVQGVCQTVENICNRTEIHNMVSEEKHYLLPGRAQMDYTNDEGSASLLVAYQESLNELSASEDKLRQKVETQSGSNAVNVCSETRQEENAPCSAMQVEIVRSKEEERKGGSKRKSEVDDKLDIDAFIRSPCEGLRSRSAVGVQKKARKLLEPSVVKKKGSHKCDVEGCRMSFKTNGELQMHKRNRCPYEGCGKRFSSHKYAIIHQRVHEDDRPLKCPWKGCSMSFKWAWARTEHIRVHTGEKPYKCKVEGCGRSFRFVSDFSRHRRKTGHYVA